jgi:hypothetical protein
MKSTSEGDADGTSCPSGKLIMRLIAISLSE